MKRTDWIGQRFGRLTVMEDSGKRKGNSILWQCRCDCGGEILATRHQLASGNTADCGCMAKPRRRKATDLTGQRFGKLTVMGDSGQRDSGNILWRCQCDCGGEILATRRKLISGNVSSCGCVPKQYASKHGAEDLTGRQFGELTVIRRAENDDKNRVRWLCRCSCSKELAVPASQLKSGKSRSCGCKKRDRSYAKYDLTGQRFGRLTALYFVARPDRVKSSYWHCRCDCGNELDVYTGSLLHGLTQSCGCWNKEQSETMHDHMHYQDNTCIEVLKRIPNTKPRNKVGFRGLFLTKTGKYRVMITFQKKHYTVGYYKTYAEAVQARLAAEETLQVGYVEAFDRYTAKAKADPDWAAENPFYFNAVRANGDFRVSTNG